uniref:Uncharacterized protein n=1 Tax=Panagrolaimus superbus TaxID=310955 RepID=A0A914Z2P5_9BILA
MNLIPRTEEERQKLLKNETEELRKKRYSFWFWRSFSWNLSFLQFWKNGYKKCSTSTTDNFNHSIVKPKESVAAEFPSTDESDSICINKINQAGLLFIKIGECPPINKLSRSYTQKLKSYSNIIELVENIVASLKTIFTASDGGPVALLINSTDLKSSLLTSFNALLNSKSTKDKMEQHFHAPLITKENAVAWMKFDFTSEITVNERCIFGRKNIEIDFNFYSFYFPTIQDFEDALMYAEKKDTDPHPNIVEQTL